MLNLAFQDEILSINSIFGEETLSVIEEDARIFGLRLPSLPSIVLRLELPSNYPNAPPAIIGTQSVGQDVPKGVGNRAADIVRHALSQIFQLGEVCIYDMLEYARESLELSRILQDSHLHNCVEAQSMQEDNEKTAVSDAEVYLGPAPLWTIAPSIIEKKSTFLARAAPVSSVGQAKTCIAYLLGTDKKAARATHNITAWRIKGADGTSYQDCDDDGETAAGSRILHLMQLMDVWDVVVVVTRWYGGVLLGSDRFRIINTAAREALVLGGFAHALKDKHAKSKSKK